MDRRDLILKIKKLGIIHKESVILRSGIKADYYCDIKKAFGQPEILNALADQISKRIPKSVTCVAGSGYGGLPLASVIASCFNLHLVAVRSTSKSYGKNSTIEGHIPGPKDRIMIIDDVLTSGSSVKEALKTLRATKAKIVGAIVVVRRGNPKLPLPCEHVFTIEELL